ncbi:Leucine aminopeptidase 1 [Serendipita sp. 398]|nr:Leucine aminopeptidase 1 [Serendipita sp. 398]
MKARFALLLATLQLVCAIPAQKILFQNQDNNPSEVVFGDNLIPTSWPGFDLNLNDRRLVLLEDASEPVWVTELEKINLKASGKNFFDVTELRGPSAASFHTVESKSYPKPNCSEAVLEAISHLSTDGPKKNLATFTDFHTRHYRSDYGKQSQKWLLGRVYDTTSSESTRDDIDIAEFHHSWGQHSIIAKIPGSHSKGTVIISAHQDSTNMLPFWGAPGADDDGSGSVTILEAYRVLLATGFKPKNDIEFHWYSAEHAPLTRVYSASQEGGLLGSQAVAAEYKRQNATVLAQIQFDMTAFVKKGTREEVGVITDFVDSNVVKFVKQLIDAYLDIPYVETKCGYACSDQ